jgi:Na+/serine symporter
MSSGKIDGIPVPIAGTIDGLFTMIERFLPWLSVLSFIIGVGFARTSKSFAYSISGLVEVFIDSYGYIAPVVIFLILTPTLIKLFYLSEMSGKHFALQTIRWFVGARILACLYAVLATTLLFGFPWFSTSSGVGSAVGESLRSLLWMLTNSVYFYAVYVSLITFAIAMRHKPLASFLAKGVDLIEYLGRIIVPLVPIFMLAIGAYVTILPELLTEALGTDSASAMPVVRMAGVPVDISTSWGMVTLYVMAAVATGIICGIWHAGLMVIAKLKMPDFSLRDYFTKYWVRIYPLLWATSSEALSTPLNLYLVKTIFPQIRDEVRQFVVGTGSILNINGTMINVFLMTGLVAAILGIEISFFQLLLSIPIVIMIGYGVPGIPGELVLFGGPIALSMGISPELTPVFLSLYIGLQIGLPDSFRTAANSTDECLMAVILNDQYSTPRK